MWGNIWYGSILGFGDYLGVWGLSWGVGNILGCGEYLGVWGISWDVGDIWM